MARTASVSRARAINTLLLFAFSLVLSGCGGLTGDGSHPPQPGVVITPVTADVRVGDTEQFSAIVTDSKGVTGGTVKWFVEGKAGGNATVGTISEAGVYKAPTVLPNPPSIHVTATSTTDATLTSEAMVSLQNPVPTVSAVQPSPISVGDFTITVTGTKFVKGAQVQLGSSALTTTFVSATQLTAKGTATQSQVGKADLVVKNPDPGAAASAPAFSVQIAQPSNIKVAVVPASVTLRVDTKQQFTASVTGSSNTAVTWAVNDIVGGNGIVGTIDAKGMYTPPGKVPNPASVKVTAKSSADSRAIAISNVALSNPIPVALTVSPGSINVGDFSISVTGGKFAPGAVVVLAGQFLTTTYVNANQLSATGTATTALAGTQSIVVQNPNPGGTSSKPISLLVLNPALQVPPATAARFLEQSTWGPTQGTILHVQQVGFQGFLNEQFAAPISKYTAPGASDDIRFAQKQFFVHAAQGPDQLRQRVAFALAQIMVISAGKIGDPSAHTLRMNMMQNDAFGNFSTLLKDVTLSPAMGNYLDMANNDGCTGCAPNENYAREVLQLFSIGLVQLNPDGTPQVDGSGVPLPSYDQDTIEGFAHTFTGWSYPPKPGKSASFYSEPYFSGPMVSFENHHDKGSKQLLNGTIVAAGGTAQADLDAAMQSIFNHPNVGPFISSQLIQKLITSNPSPEYVGRVTQVFNDNGQGIRGDLKAVISAILLDPEARRGDDSAQVQASDGKLKDPVLHILSMLRALKATTDGDQLMYYAADMRQEPFNPPSVFNFFPPDNVIPGTTLRGPEFKIFNQTTTTSRINFVNSLVYGNVGANTKTDISGYVAVAGDVNALIDAVAGVLVHGQLSADARNTLVSALSAIPDNTRRAKAAIYLIGSASQAQVQH